ncbi:ATP-binding Cassette (ABC) Superfamily [Trachipleistophora hominis]|uniref:ATP-binding Cassette (ABC) Superfamily n=1 Tax=Trachipleistophora hominis TaxID=72359 RepID=L7JYM2_TRAHO|nr:ATP-binding Cassette (ABC) Superfamily [Trachipleistophora hominis]
MTRMKIEWQHVYVRLTLTYGVSSGTNFCVLSDMCGEMEEGLLAVMGPSGCGKTTFLRMLAGRVPSGSITAGYVHYNGKERNIDQWLNNIAYVGQNDVIYKYMSARDHVVYSALFNRKKIRNLKQKIKLLFDRLDITKLMHKKMDKLSNGQRKRVLIAMELIKEPDIVIMDEPTSGLDNTSAFYLVQFLKEYALSGRIVICSIHQPDERTVNVFDRILVLNTGHTIFLGKKETCEELLRQNKIVRSPFMSFSTHMMELCWSENDGFYDANSMLRLCEIFNENQLKYSKSADRIPHFKSKDDFYLNMWINPYHIFLLLKRSMHARFSEKSALVYIAIYNTPLPVFILFEKFYLRSDKFDFAALDALPSNSPNLQQQLEDIIGYCNEFAHYTDQAYRFTIMLISTSIMYLGISDLPRVCNELALNRYSIVSYYFGSMLDGISVFIPPTTIGLLSMNIFVDAIFDMRFVFLSILFILHACIYMYFFQNLFKGSGR